MLWLGLTALAAPPDAEATRDAMGASWEAAVRVVFSLTRGEMAHVRTSSAGLRAAVVEGGHADARATVLPVLDRLEAAPDLVVAAQVVGELGAACGGCHQAEGRTRSWEPPDPPSTGVMERHRAGVDWLWAGLISGSDDLWNVGIKTLTVARSPDPSHPLISKLDAATAAAAEAEPGERASHFSEVVTACITCHALVRSGEPPGPLKDEMHSQFALLDKARQAVLSGASEDWKAAGSQLVSEPTPMDQTVWSPWLGEVRGLAQRLAKADREQAARLVAQIGEHCGACHRVLEAGPGPLDRAEPSTEQTGLDLLWWSLIAEDDERWRRGTEQLKRSDLANTQPQHRAAVWADLALKHARGAKR